MGLLFRAAYLFQRSRSTDRWFNFEIIPRFRPDRRINGGNIAIAERPTSAGGMRNAKKRARRPEYLAAAFCISAGDSIAIFRQGGLTAAHVHMYLRITPRRDGVQISAKWLAAPGYIGVKLENVCQYARVRHLSLPSRRLSEFMAGAIRSTSPLSAAKLPLRAKKPAIPATDAERQEMGEKTSAGHDRYSFFPPFFCGILGIHGERVKNDVSVRAGWENEHVEFEIGNKKWWKVG